jgi:hypothetical protein
MVLLRAGRAAVVVGVAACNLGLLAIPYRTVLGLTSAAPHPPHKIGVDSVG